MMQPKPQYSSSSSSSSPRKLCVALHGDLEGVARDRYEIDFYIVDVPKSDSGKILFGSVEYPFTKPSIQFKCSESPRVAFCVLGSTLYIFAGDNLYEAHGVGLEPFKGKYAGKFEISPQILAGSECNKVVVVEEKDLDPIKPMCERKNLPIAVPTPDGKSILVFSSDFWWLDPGRFDSSFELYDVANNSWSLIPELPKERRCISHGCDFRVVAYGFLSAHLSGFQSESRFVVELDKGLVFVLNLQTLKWEREQDIIVPSLPWREGYYFAFDELYFTPEGAYYFSKYGANLFEFNPRLSDFPDDFDDHDQRFDGTLSPYIVSLLGGDDQNGGAFDIAVVQAQRPSEAVAFNDNHSFRVVLDICTIDLHQIKGDITAWERPGQEVIPRRDPSLERTNSKTLKFLVDFDCRSYVCGAIKLFSI